MIYYKKIFSYKIKVVAVGYGFNDAHINDCLLTAIDEGSELVIINPQNWDAFKKNELPFSKKNKRKKKTQKLYDSISRYYPYKFKDILENARKEDFVNLKEFLNHN